MALLFSMFCVMQAKPESNQVLEFFLVSLSGKDIYYVLFWDFFSWLFISVVLLISSMVFFYSSYYMDSDNTRVGFIFLLLSFVVSMGLLLVSPNLISLLLGWDGLGVTSYLLVIYYSSSSSSVAGMLTFLTNRVGDIFFLISIGAMSFFFDWEKVFSSSGSLSVLVIMACITKSAQVPFSSWLPAAMAAPTPVSSLVHSSTLVTAGLYLMVRFHFFLFKFSEIIFILGSFTLVVAGLMAIFEWDLKKLIAFSTLSQLGFMVSAFGLGLVWLSFFHLITHALFKASLFLSAGVLIHNADSSQEFRNMFAAPEQLFWVASIINICLICLCGIPFTSGFYSKDLIIDSGGQSVVIFCVYFLGVIFTIVYSLRVFIYSFWRSSVRDPFTIFYEKVYMILVPLLILLTSALMGGWLVFECFFSLTYWPSVTPGWKLFYMVVVVFSFFLSKQLSGGMSKALNVKKFFFSSLWYLKVFFSSKSLSFSFTGGLKGHKVLDQGALEWIGPQGVFSLLSSTGRVFFLPSSFLVLAFLILFLLSVLFF